ncbi:metallophosphoesterase family protein [Crassaminicella thermophila]|uniref:Phosphoesterase n=1 Tax=Crassaminicella thermophila TaxID=2599308 RepID=A0A5C0SAT5_CRATE|nr:metallophosphoesterase family protein [Crassaminicella thermophila]QEK11047.1 metallophosphoesterase family protein [Crassaminicella thermophila]
MKIAIITDIHSNIFALEAVLKDIENKGIENIYCLGDLVGYGPFPNEVINLIKDKNIPTVQGNYDQSVGEELFACGCDYKDNKAMELGAKSLYWSQENTIEENKRWLRELPKKIELEVEGQKVLLVHGSPRKNNEYLYENSKELEEIADIIHADIMICGHTHKPFHKKVKGIHMINAGSAGKPKHGNPNATYMIIDIDSNGVRTQIVEVAYDYEKMAKAIENSEIPSEFAEKIRKGIS